jgi:hypothetical protein
MCGDEGMEPDGPGAEGGEEESCDGEMVMSVIQMREWEGAQVKVNRYRR